MKTNIFSTWSEWSNASIFKQTLYFIQLHQRLNRSQRIHVEIIQHNANLASYLVVNRKHLQLIRLFLNFFQAVFNMLASGPLLLQTLQYFVRTLNDRCRHTGHLSHMNSKAMFATAGNQFPKEDHLIIYLLDGNIVIF